MNSLLQNDSLFFYKYKPKSYKLDSNRRKMEKTQIKPNKDKKKNTQTGLLMGQNTNIFSQLSASYLTSKETATQEEEHFVKETQIIQYHDQNVNRLISLLRKKAEVTKAKAVVQLKQAILAMTQDEMQGFIPTYASLFQQIVVNQQSKQVYQEFLDITCSIFQKYKKVALSQIQTLYPSMLISMKLSKINKLLFTGTQQSMNQKTLTLFMKKTILKKFLFISKLLFQAEQIHLINQNNYQRNLQQYVKSFKEMMTVYLVHSKRDQLRDQVGNVVRDVCELLIGKTIDEYFKTGGRGKASLIEFYSFLVSLASKQEGFEINWKKMAKIVSQSFLDKDPVVQSTMWRYCNKDLLISLKSLAFRQKKQDQFSLWNQNLPKSEDKLLQCVSIGGISMYKALPSYLAEFPWFFFSQKDNHKSIIQKITFIRKFLQQVLAQQDQNQARIECYYQLSESVLQSLNKIQQTLLQAIIEKQGQNINDSKKAKQIKNLIQKIRVEVVSNLEKKFYLDPPTSKNSFTYYIPEYFCRILNKHQITSFNPTFNDKLVFQLYKSVNMDSSLLQVIFTKCEENLNLLLSFFQNWPQTDKSVNLDMSEDSKQYEKTAKIYLLANKRLASNQKLWFCPDWNILNSAIIYDPRLTSKQLQAQGTQDSQQLNINYSLISKNFLPIYQIPELDQHRFKFFMSLFQNEEMETNNFKFFLPYLLSQLINDENVDVMLHQYLSKANLLKINKWIVGQKQIAFLRIAVQSFITYWIKNQKKIDENLLNKFRPFFSTIGNFLKVLNTYKMDKQVLEILKSLNQLLKIPQYEQQLLQSLQSILRDIFTLINKSSLTNADSQDKLRKNRLKRINDFVQQSVWYLIRRNSGKQILIMLDLFRQQNLWRQAETKVEPWAIGYTILSTSSQQTITKMSSEMILNFQQNFRIISQLFSCQLMLPLQIYPQFKRSYLKLQHQLNKNFQQLSVQDRLNYIQKLVIYQHEKGLLTQSIGLKNVIRQTLKNYQGFSAQQMYKLSKDIAEYLIDRAITEPESDPKLNVKSIISFNILNQIPLQDLVGIQGIYQRVLQKLQKQINHLQSHFHKFLSMCLLSNSFWRTSIGAQVLLKWQQSKLIQNLLNRLVPQIKEIQPPSTYHSFVIFSTINSLYPNFGYELIQPNFESIIKIFWQQKQNERANQMYIFKQEERIRFINRVFLDISSEAAHQIIRKLPQQALAQYEHYEKVLLELEEQDEEEQAQSAQKSIQGLFIEYSELLIKMTTYFTLGQKKTIPDQTTLIQLLQCPFAGVKKTCFILLKQLYDMKLVKPLIPEIFREVLGFKLQPNSDIENITTANQIYNFLYSWLTLLTRRRATQVSSQNEQQLGVTLQDYIQAQGISDMFLTNIFSLIADKIDYLKYENEYPLSSQELLQDDFTLNVQEQTDLLQKIFSLSCKVLFAYSMNFPLFLRTFMDKSKKYRSVCQKLLRNYISDAVFSRQVTMIQVRQPQWKASGNLQIYVVKKNKQIYAQYQHDIIRIGLRLVMRSNYPLTPIHIQFGEGLKMEDGSKWALMLQSQLHNKNNSIINGILLWKENIDKKLSGVQECAICYDIVNPNGHLPKKACKTCKKKFHGNCIMKWFSKSNKSQCPLCKSQFL